MQLKNGLFKQTNTKPFELFKTILIKHNIVFVEEYTMGFYSFDFYLPSFDLFIEIDGDYWHSNPLFYPNGPQTKGQKVNYLRDINKNKFAESNKLNLVRFWENDIVNAIDMVEIKLMEVLNDR